jgi:futalosine hydrolase
VKILIAAATHSELDLLQQRLVSERLNIGVEFLVTGVGMVAMTHALTKKLISKKFDFAINIGIAGAIGPELKTGEVVAVTSDSFYELGAENGTDFISVDEMDLGSKQMVQSIGFEALKLDESIPRVSGITVNTVHGTLDAEAGIRKRSLASIESMEGAAFYYVCEREGLHSLQLRAISNRVELRNRESWDIPLALDQLSAVVAKTLLNL